MPTLDVSEVLDSPEFMTTVVLIRNVTTVGDDGLATTVVTTIPDIQAVVTSDRGRNYQLTAEGQTVVGSILVHSRTTFNDGTASTDGVNSTQPDRLTWKGRNYLVRQFDDYSEYGDGFTCARADLLPFAGGPNA